MRITVLSEDEAFVRALAAGASPVHDANVGEPSFVAGADASWWQLIVDFGVIGLPLGVVGNLVAGWTWQAMHEAKQPEFTSLNLSPRRKVKLVLHHVDRKPVEVEIESDDLEAIRLSVDTALAHADKQQGINHDAARHSPRRGTGWAVADRDIHRADRPRGRNGAS